MREYFLAEQQIKGENSETIILSYYLLGEELTDPGGAVLCELYGAEIRRRSAVRAESAAVLRITALAGEILRVVDELARCAVFPVHLEDCVQELLAKNAADMVEKAGQTDDILI